MTVVNKIKQLITVKIDELVLLATNDGKKTETEIAKWIIAASPYWRSEGYNRIIKEMQKNGDIAGNDRLGNEAESGSSTPGTINKKESQGK